MSGNLFEVPRNLFNPETGSIIAARPRENLLGTEFEVTPVSSTTVESVGQQGNEVVVFFKGQPKPYTYEHATPEGATEMREALLDTGSPGRWIWQNVRGHSAGEPVSATKIGPSIETGIPTIGGTSSSLIKYKLGEPLKIKKIENFQQLQQELERTTSPILDPSTKIGKRIEGKLGARKLFREKGLKISQDFIGNILDFVNDTETGKWITIKGTHVLVKKGETVKEALNRTIKDPRSEKEEKKAEKKSSRSQLKDLEKKRKEAIKKATKAIDKKQQLIKKKQQLGIAFLNADIKLWSELEQRLSKQIAKIKGKKKDLIEDSFDDLIAWVQKNIASDYEAAKAIAFRILQKRKKDGKEDKGTSDQWERNWGHLRKEFEILGLKKENITRGDVKRAFFRKAKETHPDRKGGTAKKFIEVSNAHEKLMKEIVPDFRYLGNINDTEERWITSKGTHIKIEKGQTKKEAIDKKFKGKSKSVKSKEITPAEKLLEAIKNKRKEKELERLKEKTPKSIEEWKKRFPERAKRLEEEKKETKKSKKEQVLKTISEKKKKPELPGVKEGMEKKAKEIRKNIKKLKAKIESGENTKGEPLGGNQLKLIEAVIRDEEKELTRIGEPVFGFTERRKKFKENLKRLKDIKPQTNKTKKQIGIIESQLEGLKGKKDFTIKYIGNIYDFGVSEDDFVPLSSFTKLTEDSIQTDFTVLRGSLVRDGAYDYYKEGVKTTLYKDWDNIKEIYSRYDYLPLKVSKKIGAHYANLYGFATNFRPNEKKHTIDSDVVIVYDKEFIDVLDPNKDFHVSPGYNDYVKGNIQIITELDHAALALGDEKARACTGVNEFGESCTTLQIVQDQNLMEVAN